MHIVRINLCESECYIEKFDSSKNIIKLFCRDFFDTNDLQYDDYSLLCNDYGDLFMGKNDSGLTLIELLVVLSIVGIVVGMASVGFIKYLPAYSLRSASREFVSSLQLAKIQAIKTNSEIAVVFDGVNEQYSIYSSPGPDNNWATLADNTVFRGPICIKPHGYGVRLGHGGVTQTVTGTAFSGNDWPDPIVFDVHGRLSGAFGTAYFQSQTQDVLAVTIRNTGSIVTRQWGGGAWQ